MSSLRKHPALAATQIFNILFGVRFINSILIIRSDAEQLFMKLAYLSDIFGKLNELNVEQIRFH